MNKNNARDYFEQQLLEQVEMLYAVAHKLTHDLRDAERITRNTLLQAWHSREKLDRNPNLKVELLTLLRQTFVKQRERPCLCGEPCPR